MVSSGTKSISDHNTFHLRSQACAHSCHPAWEGQLLPPTPRFKWLFGEEWLSSHQRAQCVEPGCTHRLLARNDNLPYGLLGSAHVEEIDHGSNSSRISLLPLFYTTSFQLIIIYFFKATCVCFKEPICTLCHLVAMFGTWNDLEK